MKIQAIINGKTVELAGETSISEFLQSRGMEEALVAVEHNLRWLRREQWATTVIRPGDRLEVIRIMAGG